MFHCLKSLLENSEEEKIKKIYTGEKTLHSILPGFGNCSHFGEFFWTVRNIACSVLEQRREPDNYGLCSFEFTGQHGRGPWVYREYVLVEGRASFIRLREVTLRLRIKEALVWIGKVEREEHMQRWNHELSSWGLKKWESQSIGNEVLKGHQHGSAILKL